MRKLLYILTGSLFYLFAITGSYGQHGMTAGSPAFSLFGHDVSLSGSLSAEMRFYTISPLPDRRDPFSARLFGAPVVKVGDLSIPIQFLLGDYQVPYRQSFNKLGASTSFGWGKVHVGHRTVSLSPLAWGNHNFLGGGIELTPGKLRLGVVAGRLKRAIEPDSTTMTTIYRPAYARKGMGVKLGYGTANSYIDLIYLQAEDDTASATFDPIAENVRPAANTVVAVSIQKEIDKSWQFKFDAGMSGWTDDKNAPENTGNDRFLSKIMTMFMQTHNSTHYAAALQSSLEYKKPTYSAKLQFDRIDPQYKTMGAYYFHDDIQRIRLSGSLRLLKNKLNIIPEIGWQTTNLAKNGSNSDARTIGGLRASYRHGSRWFFSAYSSNFQSKITQQTGPLTDSILIHQANRNLGGSISYKVPRGKQTDMLNISATYLGSTDKTMDTANNILSNLTARATYRFFIEKIKLYLTPGLIYSNYQAPFFSSTRIQPNVYVNKVMFGNKLRAGYNLGLIFASVNGAAAVTVLRNTLDLNVLASQKHQLAFRLMQLITFPATKGAPNVNELQGSIRYTYTIQ